jgi:hypothetical protein
MQDLRAQGIPFIAAWGLSRAPRRERNPGYDEIKIENGITQADISQTFRTLIKTEVVCTSALVHGLLYEHRRLYRF